MNRRIPYTNAQLQVLADRHNQNQLKTVILHKGIVKTANYIGEEIMTAIQSGALCEGIGDGKRMHITIEIKVEKVVSPEIKSVLFSDIVTGIAENEAEVGDLDPVVLVEKASTGHMSLIVPPENDEFIKMIEDISLPVPDHNEE